MEKNKIVVCIAIAVLGRLIVHVPDVTPLSALALLSPVIFSKRLSFFITFFSLLLSDFALHILLHEPWFGNWSWFTYSGWLGVTALGCIFIQTSFQARFSRASALAVISSFLFWVWTNFGTWLTAHLYPLTSQGLLDCYIAALPFLRNALIGSVIWILFFHCGYRILMRKLTPDQKICAII